MLLLLAQGKCKMKCMRDHCQGQEDKETAEEEEEDENRREMAKVRSIDGEMAAGSSLDNLVESEWPALDLAI